MSRHKTVAARWIKDGDTDAFAAAVQQPRPKPDAAEPQHTDDEFSVWLAASLASMRQIQRWVGWIAAVIIVYAAATFLLNVSAGFTGSDQEPQPVILQLPNTEPLPVPP